MQVTQKRGNSAAAPAEPAKKQKVLHMQFFEYVLNVQ